MFWTNIVTVHTIRLSRLAIVLLDFLNFLVAFAPWFRSGLGQHHTFSWVWLNLYRFIQFDCTLMSFLCCRRFGIVHDFPVYCVRKIVFIYNHWLVHEAGNSGLPIRWQLKCLLVLCRRDAHTCFANNLRREPTHTCNVSPCSSKLGGVLTVQMVLSITATMPWERVLPASYRFDMGIDLFCSGRQLSDSASTYPLWSRLSKCLTLRAFKSVESRVVVVGGCATQSHRFSVCQFR